MPGGVVTLVVDDMDAPHAEFLASGGPNCASTHRPDLAHSGHVELPDQPAAFHPGRVRAHPSWDCSFVMRGLDPRIYPL